jgi:hypothetical protein
MGLLNNNNHRINKRANLRKQKPVYDANDPYGTGFNSSSGDSFSTNFSTSGTGGGSINTSQQSPASNQFSGGGGDMMGYMQLAAAATPMVMGFIQSNKQRNDANDLETKRLAKEADVQKLMANRAAVRNPYANLAVATEAAEFEAQQVDQSLANTLDAMQAGGFGAGGATALAREAAKAKQGISADIQKQEAANQTMFAKGEELRQDEMIQQDLDKINVEIGNLDRLEQKEMDARDAQMATAQGGVSGSMQMAQSIMSNPEAMKAIGGLFGG